MIGTTVDRKKLIMRPKGEIYLKTNRTLASLRLQAPLAFGKLHVQMDMTSSVVPRMFWSTLIEHAFCTGATLNLAVHYFNIGSP